MFRDETQGDSKASERQTLSALVKLDELQDKIKRNELTVLDLSQVRVDDLKAEVKAIREFKEGSSAPVYALTVLSEGELVSGSKDGAIKLWNVETGECVRTLSGHTSYVFALAVLPGGELASGSDDNTIKIWNVKTGECVRTLSGHSSSVLALTVLPGGELASGSVDKTIKLWNVKTGECVRTLSGHDMSVTRLTVLLGGELASGSRDKTIKLWNVKTGECMRTLSGHSDVVCALTLLPGGELASGSQDKTIKLWNVKTGKCVRTLSGHSDRVVVLTMLPGGILASGSDDSSTIKLWNVKTGKCVRTMSGHTAVSALTLLPGGELAIGEYVGGSWDYRIKLWNTAVLQRRLSCDEVNGLITLLKSNRSLTRLTIRLSLEEMKASEDKVIKSLVGLVLANTSLLQLDIQKTGISEQGIRKLYEVVKQRKPALVLEHELTPKIQAEEKMEQARQAAKTKPSNNRVASEAVMPVPVSAASENDFALSLAPVSKGIPIKVEEKADFLSDSIVLAPTDAKLALQNSPTAIAERDDPALRNLLQEFKTSGLSPMALTQLQQTFTTFHTDEISGSLQWIKQCQVQWKAIVTQLATVSEFVEASADAKAEQADINKDPALSAYQRRLQQELAKFMTAYWLSTSSVFKLSDNKKGTVLNAIKGLPLAGDFLSIFVVGLQEANDKYRFYQVNRLADLFTDTHMIVQVCQCFSRRMTRAKADEIKAQKVEERVGIKGKAAGFYQDVKKSVMEAAKEWKTTSVTTGVKLQPCEALAMLDGSFLLDQILQGKASITKTSDPEMMANQFLQVLGITGVLLSPVTPSPTTALSDVVIRNAFVAGAATVPVVPVTVSQTPSQDESKQTQAALETKVQQLDQQLERLASHTDSVDQEDVRRMKESMQTLQGEIQRLQNIPQQMKDMKRQMDELSPGHSGGNQLLATRGQFTEGQALAVDSELQQHHGRLMMVESETAQQKESLQSLDSQFTSLQAKLTRIEQQQREQVSMKALHEQFERQQKAQLAQQAELEKLRHELARQRTNQSSCVVS